MKLLHSADWHLDSPFQGRTPDQSAYLKEQLLTVPGKIAALCRGEGCQMMLLSGDLFDGPYARQSLETMKNALEEAAVPVFIAPGNHDYVGGHSPWGREAFPGNVHIFSRPALESVTLPSLDCRVYGAGYDSPDCPPLLQSFRADCRERFAVGILHGDPVQTASPYCPITRAQAEDTGLDYLALGHIHKRGQFRAGGTLCAWPGCPMGRGFDEAGVMGAYVVDLEETAQAVFHPLDTPRFYDLKADVNQGLSCVLPPVGNRDFYRVTLTGEGENVDLSALAAEFPEFPNLQLRDGTLPPMDLWAGAGEDTLEGVYLDLLRQAVKEQDADTVRLAAKISRQLLDGREVKLP